MLAPAGQDMVADLFDVVMLNRYYGWYVNTGDLPAAERALEAELNAWAAKLGKPIIMPGYGAGTLPGLHSVIPAPEPRSTRRNCWRCRTGSSTGSMPSSASRSGTSPTSPPRPGVMRVDGNRKGVFARDRRPEAGAHLLRRRWRALH